MTLVIEDIVTRGPNGYPALSVAYYGEQHGDLMRDPEMLFELRGVGDGVLLDPYYWRNDFLGIEQFSKYRDKDQNLIVAVSLYGRHLEFTQYWDESLRSQGFLEAFRRGTIKH
jgi:hypothetical protein